MKCRIFLRWKRIRTGGTGGDGPNKRKLPRDPENELSVMKEQCAHLEVRRGVSGTDKDPINHTIAVTSPLGGCIHTVFCLVSCWYLKKGLTGRAAVSERIVFMGMRIL